MIHAARFNTAVANPDTHNETGNEVISWEEVSATETMDADTCKAAAGIANPWGIPGISMAKKKADEEEDEEDADDDAADADEDDDDWDGGDEEETEEDDWDPDFDEFDIPKSTKKGGGKSDGEEEDDMKFDEDLNEFDDLFGDGGDDFDDDDDF